MIWDSAFSQIVTSLRFPCFVKLGLRGSVRQGISSLDGLPDVPLQRTLLAQDATGVCPVVGKVVFALARRALRLEEARGPAD